VAAIVFDVRNAQRRLLDAGASQELAEATADLMSEAVVHNLNALVTRDYLDRVLDARFSRQDARIDQRLHELESGMLGHIRELESRMLGHIHELNERIHELKGQFRLMQAIQGLLLAGVFLPQLRALFS